MKKASSDLSGANVSSQEEALVFLTEFTMAELERLISKKSLKRNECIRHVMIADTGLNWIKGVKDIQGYPLVEEALAKGGSYVDQAAEKLDKDWLLEAHKRFSGHGFYKQSGALVHMVECTLATLDGEAYLSKPGKRYVGTLLAAAEVGIQWIKDLEEPLRSSRIEKCIDCGDIYEWAAMRYGHDWILDLKPSNPAFER